MGVFRSTNGMGQAQTWVIYGMARPGHKTQLPAAQGSKGSTIASTCATITQGQQRLLTGPCNGGRILYHFPIAPYQRVSTATTVIDSLVLGLDPSDG